MSEYLGCAFLRLLFHTVRQHRNSGGAHPTAGELNDLTQAAAVLTQRRGETVFSVHEGQLYLDRSMLPHASLELRGLLGAMSERGVASITLLPNAGTAEIGQLAEMLAGKDDLPRGGVRINERPFRLSDLQPVPTAGVRRAYAESLDMLQRVAGGLALDLDRASAVVQSLVSAPEPERRASLLLASTQNCDDIVVYHSVNVCVLSLALGSYLGLGEEALRLLGIGALVHDVGRIARADGIAEKRERLTGDDWSAIQMHPQDGAAIVLAAAGGGQELAARVALEHHVRADGGGYPELAPIVPHPFSRIVAIADVYDAITSARPHRPGRAPGWALRMLADGAGTVHDPVLVAAFCHLMGTHPPGSLVRLTGGELALVLPSEAGETVALVVQTAVGEEVIDGRPFPLRADRIAEEVLRADAGVEPAALLERALELAAAP